MAQECSPQFQFLMGSVDMYIRILKNRNKNFDDLLHKHYGKDEAIRRVVEDNKRTQQELDNLVRRFDELQGPAKPRSQCQEQSSPSQ